MWSTADGARGPWRLAVTYANDKFTDGVGAQLQRIYELDPENETVG
jgi:hypothetical protein